MKFAVMRHPVLMEDEGRNEFVNCHDTKKEAEEWIAKQKDQYFKPTDYFILEATGEHR